MATEILSLDEITASQAQKEVTHNTALRQLEGRLVRVLDRNVGTTPASPANGDTYIVDQLGGAWSVAAINDIAHFFGGAWNFYTPIEGLRVWVNDENVLVIFDGSIWTIFAQTRANTNVIINGNFDIWQRGTSFTAPAALDYSADRWQWSNVGSGVVNLLQSTTVPDDLSDFSLQVDVTAADVTIVAGDRYDVSYNVEGYDAMRFGLGTADATQMTLSFRCRSPKTGIHCVAFRNGAANRSFVVEYTIAVADTFEFFTITITGDVAGTWLTDSGLGLRVSWALAVGSDFQGVANTWNAANDIATVNQVNVMDNIANNFHISRVQLEVGGADTAFERRAFQQELALCQRYYTKTFQQSVAPAQNAGVTNAIGFRAGSDGQFTLSWGFPVTMRATPTFVTYNPSASNAEARNTNDNTDTPINLISSGESRAAYRPTIDSLDANDNMLVHISADTEL